MLCRVRDNADKDKTVANCAGNSISRDRACIRQPSSRIAEHDDITTANPKLAVDGRDAAAEFALNPLLSDLHQNRPLRLELPGVFVELPVPPFVVGEWRSLPSWREG